MRIYQSLLESSTRNGPKSSGALLDDFGVALHVQVVAGATTRAQKVKTHQILGSPREPKMHQKSILFFLKIGRIFHIDYGTIFLILGDLFSKNLSKMEGLGCVFLTSLRICEKYDFERASVVFATIFNFESIMFRT